jgi:hypothetical protein
MRIEQARNKIIKNLLNKGVRISTSILGSESGTNRVLSIAQNGSGNPVACTTSEGKCLFMLDISKLDGNDVLA